MMGLAKLMEPLILPSFFVAMLVSPQVMAQNAAINRLVLQLEGPVLQRDNTAARKPLSLDRAMQNSMACMERRLEDQKTFKNPPFFQSFLRMLGLGSKPYALRRRGAREVVIEFKEAVDAKAVGKTLTAQAKLSFHQVKTGLPVGGLAPLSVAELQRNPWAEMRRLPPVAPPGYKVLVDRSSFQDYIVIKKAPFLTGLDIVAARPGFDETTSLPAFTFRFSKQGARVFGAFTKANIKKPFAVVLDGKLLSAPIIREPIVGGWGQVSGHFSVREVAELVWQLRTCSLSGEFKVLNINSKKNRCELSVEEARGLDI